MAGAARTLIIAFNDRARRLSAIRILNSIEHRWPSPHP
jgi:hypothetical protein